MDESTALAVQELGLASVAPEVMEKVVISGDLSNLNPSQRTEYYAAVCKSLKLNPLTKPFEYLNLNGKLRLYALRDCADQLRKIHGISIYIANREKVSDIYIVTARAKDRHGREDESTGAVPIGNLKGDALANAYMKAETKAKRRVTLSIAGLGFLDEIELETIPASRILKVDVVPTPDVTGQDAAMVNDPPTDHPDAKQINDLIATAKEAGISLEQFGEEMRRFLDEPAARHITKKFLRERMTMHDYDLAHSEYTARLEKAVEAGDVIDGEEQVPDYPDPQATHDPVDATIAESLEGEAVVLEPEAEAHVEAIRAELQEAAPRNAEYATVDQIRDLRAEALKVSARTEQEVVSDLQRNGGRLKLDLYRTMRNQILDQQAERNGGLEVEA